MKIAVFGWYGHNNAGDERIKHCLNLFLLELGGIDKVDFFDLHDNAISGPTNRFDDYDLVIIGGGGLIYSQHNYHDFIIGLRNKIITIGVSVEGDLVGNRGRFAQALLEKSTVVIVRDHASAEKLAPFDLERKTIVSADLTFLDSYEPKILLQNNKVGINLFPKLEQPLNSVNNRLKTGLNRLGFNFQPKTENYAYIMQNSLKDVDFLPIPLYCVAQSVNLPIYQMNDVNFLRLYFKEVSESFNHESIDQCNLFISMRLHGVIFAIQKGIPVITFSTYPKQINFMKEVGLEKLIVDHNDLESLPRIMRFISQNLSQILQQMVEYREKATLKIRRDLINTMNLLA